MLDGLASLPVAEVRAGLQFLRAQLPSVAWPGRLLRYYVRCGIDSADLAPSNVCSICAGHCCGSCAPASHSAILSARQVERPRCHVDTRRQDRQCVWELEQRLSPACWSFSSRRLDYDRISAAWSGNVRDVADAARMRSAATEASSMNDNASAVKATQAVLQLPWRQHCCGCVLARHWTVYSTGLGIVTSLTYRWLIQCKQCDGSMVTVIVDYMWYFPFTISLNVLQVLASNTLGCHITRVRIFQ